MTAQTSHSHEVTPAGYSKILLTSLCSLQHQTALLSVYYYWRHLANSFMHWGFCVHAMTQPVGCQPLTAVRAVTQPVSFQPLTAIRAMTQPVGRQPLFLEAQARHSAVLQRLAVERWHMWRVSASALAFSLSVSIHQCSRRFPFHYGCK